ncbi:hypothetical protein [Kosakonia oryzae]|uniref:Uncharacterized protein n=1 Tax=Kosakonia oryzae TaxID=497725 RepID=A0AA94H3D7_9ENTR|nr:hypothetical protein [Kosakonia oryzae]SFC43024.1 hypothetical protein SAMN05216286_2256 [Kosakonia oryzae]
MCLLFPLSFLLQAAAIDITTDFAANISQPHKNKFTNTTPVSGFCVSYSAYCASDEFSIIIPGLEANKYLDTSSADLEKNHTSITVDGTPRTLTLTDPATGNTITVVFRIAFFGMTFNRLDANSGSLYLVMTSTGLYPSGGCSGRTGVGTASGSSYSFGWGIPERKVTCYRSLQAQNGSFHGDVRITNFSLGYTLITPNPLEVYGGNYEGELVYNVGANGDLDFNAQSTSDDEIRILLKATVKHEFNLKFPTGGSSENVILGAEGGWKQWINGGKIPHSLSKEVPFSLFSSTKFTVAMQCEHDGGNQNCGLKNTQNSDIVPVEVMMTMPGFKSNGVDVKNMRMTSAVNKLAIDAPDSFIVDRRSHVDFRVLRPAVETMVKAPGSTWKGAVTLVFDAQTQ